MRGAFTCGLAGQTLTTDECAFLSDAHPWGVILFARNCETPDGVRRLCDAIREAAGDETAILIDQEGGRVQRLRPPHWRRHHAARTFGDLYARSPEDGLRAAMLGARLLASELAAAGIDVNCAPVLDVAAPETHDAIGDRAYSSDPDAVAQLARAVCDGFRAHGVVPVLKHIPGQGRATADTHHDAAIVEASDAALKADAAPFRALNDVPVGMTAHVTYRVWDDVPATQSRTIIDSVIRQALGFDGLLLSDDLSMKALGGSMAERAGRALKAGCDIALHCCGDLAEAREVADAVGLLDAGSVRRAGRVVSWRSGAVSDGFDANEAAHELSSLLA